MMKILNLDILGDEEGETVEVNCLSKQGEQETFFVQTTDGKYQADLGCWVVTINSHCNINPSDYPGFDIPKIIEAAENYIGAYK